MSPHFTFYLVFDVTLKLPQGNIKVMINKKECGEARERRDLRLVHFLWIQKNHPTRGNIREWFKSALVQIWLISMRP